MKLSIYTLRDIALGAAEVVETEQGIIFHRFTREQRDFYRERNLGFYKKALAPSGVKLRFRTDSTVLGIKGAALSGSTRKYYSFDLFVNGEKRESFENFTHLTEKPVNSDEYPLGDFAKEFDLGAGEKEVLLYFPVSVKVYFSEIYVSDESFLEPVKPEKKMLVFGDSITQGYDAAYSCNSYVSRLCRLLGVEEFNKAIGGEVFWPALAEAKETFVPDLISVAYGTNDWSKSKTLEEFRDNAKGFFVNLSKTYPGVPIYAVSPIWRKNYMLEKPCGDFHGVQKYFEEIAREIPQMTVIRGWDFVPQDSQYFRDGTLHPNDEGFAFYADALYAELKKLI